MPVGDYLGWATSLINDMGLRDYIIAGAVISLAVGLYASIADR